MWGDSQRLPVTLGGGELGCLSRRHLLEWLVDLSHGSFRQVAPVVGLPFVVGFGEDSTDETDHRGIVGEDTDHIRAAFDLLIRARHDDSVIRESSELILQALVVANDSDAIARLDLLIIRVHVDPPSRLVSKRLGVVAQTRRILCLKICNEPRREPQLADEHVPVLQKLTETLAMILVGVSRDKGREIGATVAPGQCSGFDQIELDSQRASLGHIRTERRNRRRWGRYQRLTPVVALRIHSPEVRS